MDLITSLVLKTPFGPIYSTLTDFGFNAVLNREKDTVLLQNREYQVTLHEGSVVVRRWHFGIYGKHVLTVTEAINCDDILLIMVAANIITKSITNSNQAA